jgi:nitrogen fixation-related uncharacterized protein
MSWNAEQWEGFCALLEAAWPGEFDDADRKAWRILLDEVSPEQGIFALKALMHSGLRFRPSASELLAAVRDDPSAPTFDEALALIYRAACREHSERLSWLRARSPLVARFLEIQGTDRVFLLELDDPQYGELRRKELREAWDRFCASSEKRTIAALASGDREGLSKLDPLADVTSIEEGRRRLPSGSDNAR